MTENKQQEKFHCVDGFLCIEDKWQGPNVAFSCCIKKNQGITFQQEFTEWWMHLIWPPSTYKFLVL